MYSVLYCYLIFFKLLSAVILHVTLFNKEYSISINAIYNTYFIL